MADEISPANGAADPAAPGGNLSIQKIYVKDASFEVPNGPGIFQDQVQPEIQLNLSQKVSNFSKDLYEVTLSITVTCKAGEKTAYLAEVQQAGVFGITGLDEQNTHGILGTYCPHTLFPYARQIISDLIQAGGFPPFLMQPINFEQIYSEQLKRNAEAQSAAPASA